MFWNYQKYLGD